MRKFLKSILLFIIPIVVVAYPLDILISTQLKKDRRFATGEYAIWNDIYNHKVNSDIVIYGSSRGWVHIAPEVLADSIGVPVYNLGIDGHSFELQYLRHQLLFKNNKRPKAVILAIDVTTFKRRADLYNLEQFLPYMLFDKDVETITSKYKGFERYDYYIPLLRYQGQYSALTIAMKNMLGVSQDTTWRHKGYQGINKPWKTRIKRKAVYKAEVDSITYDLFEAVIRQCQQEGIKLVFVYTPEHVIAQEFVKNRIDIMSVYDSFSSKYHIPFLDYSADSICYDTSYFYNPFHLNEKGSQLFSKKLAHDLKPILQ